ncbi:hypothetical protein ZWY2020_025232 [Hordeum vulgare]|nr:hypothetical protein ZWY2020_025232 [Hordeum vulgare]
MVRTYLATHCLVSSVKSKLKARSLRSSSLSRSYARRNRSRVCCAPCSAPPRPGATAVQPEQLPQLVLQPRRLPHQLAGFGSAASAASPALSIPDGTCDAIDANAPCLFVGYGAATSFLPRFVCRLDA